MQRSYRATSQSCALNTMYFLLIFFFWQGAHTETTNSTIAKEADLSYEIIISKDQSNVKEIEVLNNQSTELSCNISDVPKNPTNMDGYWKKNGRKIEKPLQPVKTDKHYSLKDTFTIDSWANYSCVFNHLGEEYEATFVFKVPEMYKQEKPLVSYIGDTVVLKCEFKTPANKKTNSWRWYKVNGTEQEHLNFTNESWKYKIYLGDNTTKLTVHNLTLEDAGKYVCSAVFGLGNSNSQVELKVLSFTEPLKPFIAIAIEVVILVTLILLYEKHSQSRKRESETTENGPQSEQASKLTVDETNGVDGGTTTRQRKVEQ